MIINRSFKDFKFRHRSKKNQIIYTFKKVKNDEEVIINYCDFGTFWTRAILQADYVFSFLNSFLYKNQGLDVFRHVLQSIPRDIDFDTI